MKKKTPMTHLSTTEAMCPLPTSGKTYGSGIRRDRNFVGVDVSMPHVSRSQSNPTRRDSESVSVWQRCRKAEGTENWDFTMRWMMLVGWNGLTVACLDSKTSSYVQSSVFQKIHGKEDNQLKEPHAIGHWAGQDAKPCPDNALKVDVSPTPRPTNWFVMTE